MIGVVALGFAILYFALALVVPLLRTRRRTGSSSFRSTPGVAGRIAQLLFVTGNALIVAGPALDLVSNDSRINSLDRTSLHFCGIALASAALVLIAASRRAMGPSWRVGVDVHERTALVTEGPFARVRHPIYTAMVALSVGIALMVPNLFTAAAVAAFLIAVELQARVLEDPYLRRTHPEFPSYARKTGRFLPGIGRLKIE